MQIEIIIFFCVVLSVFCFALFGYYFMYLQNFTSKMPRYSFFFNFVVRNIIRILLKNSNKYE